MHSWPANDDCAGCVWRKAGTYCAAGGGTAIELLTAALVEACALYESVGKVAGRLLGFVAHYDERVGVLALVG